MDLARLRRSLLRWFSRAKRPLPWRLSRDPYAIWVSETMLQQTTVATVIPFYSRFMKRLPTTASLAASDEDTVLSLWSGLGYYSRARNLRLAAQRIAETHHGLFPRDVDTAMTLPGVGRYTASAVTSIAYRTRAAVLDGNVRRVLSRLFAVHGLGDARGQELALRLLSRRSPGSWNEAMMELGATVCTPRKPLCTRCPVALECRGRERPEYWSGGRPRRAGVRTRVEMAWVERQGDILLTRNPMGELMGGLFEFPHAGLPRKAKSPESQAARGETQPAFDERCIPPGRVARHPNIPDIRGPLALPSGRIARLGATPESHQGLLEQRYRGILRIDTEALATIRHSVTHHRIEATIFRASLLTPTAGRDLSFHSLKRASRLPLGGLTRKALRALGLPKIQQPAKR